MSIGYPAAYWKKGPELRRVFREIGDRMSEGFVEVRYMFMEVSIGRDLVEVRSNDNEFADFLPARERQEMMMTMTWLG